MLKLFLFLIICGVFCADNVDVQQFLMLINNLRQASGVGAVCYNDKLNKAAQVHSLDMSQHNSLQHVGTDGSQPWDRIKAQGFSMNAAAENIAVSSNGFDTNSLFAIWKNSPPHLANMIGAPYKFIGLSTINGFSTLDLANGNGEVCSNGNAAPTAPSNPAPANPAPANPAPVNPAPVNPNPVQMNPAPAPVNPVPAIIPDLPQTVRVRRRRRRRQ